MAATPFTQLTTRRWLVAAGSVLIVSADTPAREPSESFKLSMPKLRTLFSERVVNTNPPQQVPPKAPPQFNPDPGGGAAPATATAPTPRAATETQALPFAAEPFLPDRSGDQSPPVRFGEEALPPELKLPRSKVRSRPAVEHVWEHPEFPLGSQGLGLLPHSEAVPNRWFLNFPHWQRYRDPSHETPYQYETPLLWHPYRQSTLKGDVPIFGEEIFANITAKSFSLFENRILPVPSGVSTAAPNSSEFFGRGEQTLFSTDTSLAVEIFQGETSFKPVHWLVRFLGVYNYNYIRVRENGLLDPDPRGTAAKDNYPFPNTSVIQSLPPDGHSVNPVGGIPSPFTSNIRPGDAFNYLSPLLNPAGGAPLTPVDPATNNDTNSGVTTGRTDFKRTRSTERQRDFFAFQEAFGELHISDLSDNYDFVSSRWGLQPFVSDFRGFIFADTNLGARIFGNFDNNRWQYNLAYFNQREKDTYSDLNTFDSRHQQILIANLYHQDTIWPGYTSQWSIHTNFDDGGTHYDKNGFLTRPALLGSVPDEGNFFGDDGSVRGHEVKSVYLGWTGDGHIGRLNINHAFYQVLGQDNFNSLAGRSVDINAQMAALELSYDRDWYRLKLSGFYASGDSDPTDGTARGFDSILDNPFFIGGPFSWYVHQGANLAGTAVNLKQRDSLIPNLRTSKTEGQSNFVNPGVMILGAGTDVDITPKLKGFANANYVWLAQTEPIATALQSNKIKSDLGLDTSIGFKYRPLLIDNMILSAGLGCFFPGNGYRSIYRTNTEPVPGFGPQDDAGKVDPVLYNIFFTVTLTY